MRFPIVLPPLLACLLAAEPMAQCSGSISNSVISLSYAPDSTYGVKLTSVQRNLGPTIDLLPVDLWELDLRHVVTGQIGTVVPSQMTWSSVSCSATATQLTVTWNDVTWSVPTTPRPIDVTLTAKVDPTGVDDTVSFELSAEDDPSNTRISIYRMAVNVAVGAISSQFERQELAVPYLTGGIMFDPIHNCYTQKLDQSVLAKHPDALDVPESHPGTYSMQWMAYYDPGDRAAGCFYWGTKDTGDLTIKPYNIRLLGPEGYLNCTLGQEECPANELEGTGLALGAWHYPSDNLTPKPGGTTTLPFPVVITVLEGTWYDAARYYRSWMETLSPTEAWHLGPMVDNPDFSPTVLDTEMFGSVGPKACTTTATPCMACGKGIDHSAWSTLASPGGAGDDHIDDIKSEFGVDNILMRHVSWDYNSYSAYIGDWLPPRPAWITEMAQVDDPVAVYFNPVAVNDDSCQYTSTAPGYSGVEPWTRFDKFQAVIENVADGCNKKPSVNNCDSLPLADCPDVGCPVTGMNEFLCFGTPFPADYMIHIAEQLSDLAGDGPTPGDIQGMYLDLYHTEAAICYRTEHAQYHGEGDGDYFIAGKHDAAAALKTAIRGAPWNVEDFFLIVEGVNESLLDVVELTWDRAIAITTDDACARVAKAPIWQTVYNDYHMMSSTAAVKLASLDNVDHNVLRGARMAYASNLFQGVEPYCTVVLSSDTLSEQTQADSGYAEYIDMIENFTTVLTYPEVRDLVVFGERLRDPVSTVAKTVSIPSGLPSGVANYLLEIVPYSTQQPLTYAASFGKPGEAKFGLLFLNWTDSASDASQPLFTTTPGPQTFKVDVDPEKDFGIPPGNYTIKVFTAGGVSGPVPWSYAGSVVTLPSGMSSFTVSERSAEFWLIE